MRECEERLEQMSMPVYTVSESIWAQEDGFRQGWKQALEWILKLSEKMEDDHVSAEFELLLNEELES